MAKRIVAFGEVMMRLSPAPGEVLGHTPALSAWFGGAEANAAAAVAQLGGAARVLTTLPDNTLGRGAAAALAGRGVDTGLVRFIEGRMGLYFASFGAGIQPPEVLYDRAGSAFALDPTPASIEAALEDAAILHITGITPAISPRAAEATLGLARDAVSRGVKVSFDGNFRAKLWAAWAGDGPRILRDLMNLSSIAFVDHRDIALLLGEEISADDHAARAFAEFPKLEIIAATERRALGVSHHALAAAACSRGGAPIRQAPLSISPVIDRIGAGDAFAGAMLWALADGASLKDALPFALHVGAVKHGQRGDTLTLTANEARALMGATSLDVRR